MNLKRYRAFNAENQIVKLITISDTGNEQENRKIASAKLSAAFGKYACFLQVKEAK